jgi:Tol biopolymer transport system component
MTGRDARRVQDILEAVKARSLQEREAALEEACGDDPELRREVASILETQSELATTLETMPLGKGTTLEGQSLGHYQIERRLGEGGMGVVYRARDTALDRLVALKFLAPHLSASPEAKLRLANEAKAASSLDHPNICTIYEIDETPDGQLYIAMAFREGETLKRRIARGPIPVPEALELWTQMARGLSRAHDQGIVHRDIKPANVLVGEDGSVKILDFGLAKVAESAQLTRTGTTMGTAAYMSPEQAAGGAVDARTDVWSAGVVLYEMLAGRRPFPADNEQAVIHGILHRDPEPLASIRPEVPRQVERVVTRMLGKRPEERYARIDEAIAELADAQARPGTERRSSPFAVVGLAGVAVGLLAIAAALWRSRSEPALPHGGPPGVALHQVTSDVAVEEFPAFSPDSTRIAFSREVDGYRQVFVRDLDEGGERQITEGSAEGVQPAWGADGESLLYVRSTRADGKADPADPFSYMTDGDIWQVTLASGRATTLIEDAFNPCLSPDGTRLAFDASWAGPRRIWISDLLGKNPRQLTTDESEFAQHTIPRWSPDGARIVFQHNLWTTKWDVWVADVATGTAQPVTDDGAQDVNPVWAPDGAHVYFSSYRSGGMNVWRIPVNPQGRPTGPPEQVTSGAGQDVELAFSPDGRLAFSILQLNADIWRIPVDPSSGEPRGEPEALVATTREDSRGAWSPDGSRIAFNSDREGHMNLWLLDLASGTSRQVTSGPGGDFQAHWSPEGTRLAFFSSRAGNADVWTVDLETGELTQLTTHPAVDINPFYSPDGAWIAFQADRDGRLEVWAMRADGSAQRQLSRGFTGTHYFLWTEDSRHVVYRSPEGLWRASPDGGAPELFEPRLEGDMGGWHMSFSPDRSRIMDNNHKALLVKQLGSGRPSAKVYEFHDPEIRIDYSVWSPDGRWVLFDRSKPSGGDIWIAR